MKKARWVSAAAGTVVLVAGFAAPASAALADGGGDGNGGVSSVLSGNTVNAPVSVPADVCGIAVGLLGFSNASCQGGSFSNTTIGGGPVQTPCPTPPPSCGCTPPRHHHHHKTPPPSHHKHHHTPPGGGGGTPPGGQGTGSQGTPPTGR